MTDPRLDEQIRIASAMDIKEVFNGDPDTVQLLEMIIPIIERQPMMCHARAFAILFGTLQVELSRAAGIPTDFDHNMKIFEILARTVFGGGMLNIFGVEPAAPATEPTKPGRLLTLVKDSSHGQESDRLLIDFTSDAPGSDEDD